MQGNQFEFDETGESFYYFLITLYLFALIPITYFYWPKIDNDVLLESNQNFMNRKKKFIRANFIIAWIVFFWLVYKISQIETEWKEFNPFTELGVSKEANMSEIKNAYEQLSLKFHPEKGGDPKRFIRLTKSFMILNNEKYRNNWEKYGNPNGPRIIRIGFALPKWFVDKKNSVLVLGVYFVVILGLPIFLLLRYLRPTNINSEEIPFVGIYKVRGQILISNHLNSSISFDKNVMVKKYSFHINDMISIVAQFVTILHHSTTIYFPQWEIIEYCMKLNEIFVRGISGIQSPIMQLPLIKEGIFRYFVTRERNIPGIKQLQKMEKKDCHDLLGPFSDNKYRDLIHVSSSIQLIILECHCEVMDKEYSSTPSSIMKVSAKIIRTPSVYLVPRGISSKNSKWSNQDIFWFSDDQSDGALYSSVSVPSEVYFSEANLNTVCITDCREIYVIKVIPCFQS